MTTSDFIVIGAGIAGASTAYFLARGARVTVLERESQPGYHTTGRSAALFAESYGTPQVRALTLASRGFLEHPPEGFTEHPLISERGALFVGGPGQEVELDTLQASLRLQSSHIWRLDAAETRVQVPVLEPGWVSGGVYDPLAADMDVHALHQGYLRAFRARGGRVVCDADVTAMAHGGKGWRITAGGQTYEAPVVINAAGAWCDTIAALAGAAPIGLQPMRRSAFTFAPPADVDIRRWPAVIGVDESFYFKPDAGQLLGSPANADPVPPHDVRPEDEDIARGIERIETATCLRIRRPAHTWAGLRSFVADGDLVGGFDPVVPGFFWCAAQGGYGIQTSVAMGESCAALARGEILPPRVEHYGVTEAMLSPRRLAKGRR
jgi:D-arginine dehydrogenase